MNTSDPKQQKQLVILVLLAICLIVAVVYQSGAHKPVLTPSATKVDRKKAGDGVVTVGKPFVQPVGNERDPFVVPDQFDDVPNMAAPVSNPSGGGATKPSGLMPLPDLPRTSTIPEPVHNDGYPVQPTTPAVVKSPPDFRLLGTIVGNNQMAIIQGASGGDQVALGDQAADGSQLVKVTRETATFVKEGRSYILTVGED